MVLGLKMRSLVVATSLLGVLLVPGAGMGNIPYVETASGFKFSVKFRAVGKLFRDMGERELADKPGCAWFDRDYTLCWGVGRPEVLVDMRVNPDVRNHSDLGDLIVVDGRAARVLSAPGV